MSKFIVLSAAHTPDWTKWRGLKETAEYFSVPLIVTGNKFIRFYGSNDPSLFYANYEEGLKVLQDSKAEYAMITDSFDCLVTRWDEVEIIAQIEGYGGLLISTEANCFPTQGPWKQVYDANFVKSGNNSPWRYCNGGQYCGRREQVISLIEELWRRMPKCKFNGQSNEILHDLYVEGYPMALDYRCEVFQSMFTEEVKWIKESPAGILNILTGSFPQLLHFNGCAPGIEKWKNFILERRD